MDLNIINLGDDGDTLGLVQEQELRAKNGHLGSHPVATSPKPRASYCLSLCLYSVSSKGREGSLSHNSIRFKFFGIISEFKS